MELLPKEEFTELINYKGSNCISVYIPTHRAGVEVNQKQDAILLKNALQDAIVQLQKQGLPSQEIDSIMQPGFDLYKNEVFWNNQLDGLALFLAKGFSKVIQLPFAVNEELFVNSSFHVSPLLPAITNNEDFYLLVLSKKDAQFFQGNAFGLQRLEVEGLPNGMDDVIHFEEKEGEHLLRQGGKGGTGSANFHGHSNGQPDEKTNLKVYFQEVDRTLFAEVLHDKNAPLVLAGVEYLIPIYRSVSSYNNIAENAITGNQERESTLELFTKCREVLAPYFKQETNKALQNYYNQVATPLTSSMPETIIPASFYAQVSDLFICKDEHIWGKFNADDNKLEIHPQKTEGDECLINKAAAQTYLNGGAVYLLDKEKMPKESTIAAFMRY
ncbi:hypothetical protein FFF34_014035 [Inquilinus sp. KBS0705]|nr:hypothetical protein FFF34_014035 [Inquilinus sp. KBS0705]